MRKTIPQQIAANRRASLLFVFGLILVLSALVTAIYGFYSPHTWYYGTAGAVALGFIAGLIAYYSGSDILLSISQARPADQREDQVLNNVVEEMAIAAGIPKPKIYVIDDPAPNAFATGRDPQHAAICFTTGIISKLDRDELQGVAAHELSHIRNYDTRFMTTVSIIAGMIPLIADGFRRSMWYGGGRRSSNSRDSDNGLSSIFMIIALVLSILAPIFAMLLQFAISRQREFLADASGAELTRYPEALARALQKIESDPAPLRVANRATQGMYIINPLSAQGLSNLMSTHPSTEARIQALMGLAGNYHHSPAIDNPMGTQTFADMPPIADQTMHEPPPRLGN
jgi:heat shock protein HtpX